VSKLNVCLCTRLHTYVAHVHMHTVMNVSKKKLRVHPHAFSRKTHLTDLMRHIECRQQIRTQPEGHDCWEIVSTSAVYQNWSAPACVDLTVKNC
jgi:hypothetical protein